MIRLVGFLVAMFAGVVLARADATQDCVNATDPDVRIRGCTAALQRSTLKQEYRSAGYSNRGMGYYDKGDYERAIADYSKAIEINGNNAFAYNNRCLAYHKKGDYDRAIADCSKSIELKNAGLNVPYTGRGDAYAAKGQYDLAAADYTRALELNPNYDRARQALASLAKLRAGGAKTDAGSTAADHQAKIEIVPIVSHSEWVTSVAYSPDGSLLLSGSNDGKAKLWDARSGRLVRTLRGHPQGVAAVVFSPDGSRLATGGQGPTSVKLWDTKSGEFIRFFVGHEKAVTSIAFSPDGKRLVSGSYDKTARVWDVETGKLLFTFKGHVGTVGCVVFSPDGAHVLSGSGGSLTPRRVDNSAKIWDSKTGQIVRSFAHSGEVAAVAFSPDGERVATGSDDKVMTLWDAKSGRSIRTFSGYAYPMYSVAFSRDGASLISGNLDGIKVWDSAATQPKLVFSDASIKSVALSPDGKRLVSGGTDHAVKLWDVATGRLIFTAGGGDEAIAAKPTSAGFSPDGLHIASGSDAALWFWDVPSARAVAGDRQYKHLVYSPDGTRILAGGDSSLKLVDAVTGQLARAFPDISNDIAAIAFSPDGRRILAGLGYERAEKGSAGKVRMWDAASGRLLTTFRGHGSEVKAVAFSPDGIRVVTGGGHDGALSAGPIGNGKIRWWDPETGRLVRNIDAHYYAVTSLAFSADGSRLVSGSGYDVLAQGLLIPEIQTVRIWDANSGQLLHSTGPYAGVTAVAFSPDGRWALSGSDDSELVLWDATNGQRVRTFDGHSGAITSVSFSRDGSRVLSASNDGTVRVWNAANCELLSTLMGERQSWLAILPSGFFATSSPSDTASVTVVRGLDLYDVNQMYQALYDPDLVREKLAGDPSGEAVKAAAALDLAKVIESGQAPDIAILSPANGASSGEEVVTARALLTDRGGGIGRIEWRVNGITVAISAVPAGRAASQEVEQAIALEPGENRIDIVAYNARNLLSSLPVSTTINFAGAANAAKPTLHVLAIGINTYVDRGWRPAGQAETFAFPPLALAVKDATAFGEQMQRGASGLYADVRVTMVTDTDATRENLSKVVDKLAAEIHPRDTFVLFAAAHGKSESGHFYLIPQDYDGGPDPAALAARAIGQGQLQDWLSNRIKAKKAIILLDTCESGALVGGHARSRTDASFSEAALGRLHEATGRPVLTAAAEGKPAFEGYEGHGVFTWALLDALKNGDRNGNGTIELSELVAHVQDQVPKIAARLNGRGATAIAVRGSTGDAQSARFGSKGEDFALTQRLQ